MATFRRSGGAIGDLGSSISATYLTDAIRLFFEAPRNALHVTSRQYSFVKNGEAAHKLATEARTVSSCATTRRR